MPHRKARCKPSLDLHALFIFALLVFSAVAAAKEAKTYPESGKIIGIGQNEHTKNHPNTGKNGTMGGGTYSVYSHTYKIETDTRIYEMDCGKTPTFIGSTGKECGGDKPLQIGDVIQFRVEKGSAHIALSDGAEQKLRILNEEAKPDAKPADAKTSDAKQ
jgi:hypothetical protein